MAFFALKLPIIGNIVLFLAILSSFFCKKGNILQISVDDGSSSMYFIEKRNYITVFELFL